MSSFRYGRDGYQCHVCSPTTFQFEVFFALALLGGHILMMHAFLPVFWTIVTIFIAAWGGMMSVSKPLSTLLQSAGTIACVVSTNILVHEYAYKMWVVSTFIIMWWTSMLINQIPRPRDVVEAFFAISQPIMTLSSILMFMMYLCLSDIQF